MKKTILTVLLASSTLMIFAKPANAEVVDSDESTVGIQFNTDGPEKPGPGPYKDNLALVWTPSKFNFGKQDPVANVATYSNTVAGPQHLVVNDDRTAGAEGTYSAWKTTAQLSELTATNGSETLSAKLTFGLSAPTGYNIGEVDPETNDYAPNPPTEANKPALPTGHNIEVGQNVSLEAGSTSAATVLAKKAADENKGGAATTVDNAKLIVTDSKGSAAAGKTFKGKVTWNLDNTY